MLLTIGSTLSLSAQDNNRLDEIGKNYLPSLSMIKADVDNGKVTEINQETIDYYAQVIPLKGEMNMELANEMFDIKKGGPVKFEEFLANAKNISTEAKGFISKICNPKIAINEINYGKYYTNLVSDIEKTAISSQEKDMLLALNSLAFNVRGDGTELADGGTRINNIRNEEGLCYVESEGGSVYLTATECVILVAGVGFITGFQNCGFWCGVGGAVIFGVIAAISVC